MTTTEPSFTERTGTAEDVELLATRLMDWTHIGTPDADMWWDAVAGHAWHGDATKALRESREFGLHPFHWNPFLSASADVQVLERVREVWGPTSRQARAFVLAVCQECGITTSVPTYAPAFVATLAWNLSVGTWARAALAVLREMERAEEGR